VPSARTRVISAALTRLLAAALLAGGCVESARSADAPAQPQRPVAPKSTGSAGKPAPEPAAPARADVAAPADALATEAAAFFDEPDGAWRDALVMQPIRRVERGRGGRSLGFKITLADGHKGYFKPDQSFSAANWFGEVASYHLDRMLGLGRVPCVVSRQFTWAELVAAAGEDMRKDEVLVVNGKVRGAFVAWVSGGLEPLPEAEGWERWVRVKTWPSASVSPFQRPAVWKLQLGLVRRLGDNWRSKEERLRRRNLQPIPDREDRPAELSDLLVFDYLTRNQDRWGGDNANVLVRGPAGPLVFLDNGAAFEPGDARPGMMEARLHVVQRFRRGTIAAARAFDVQRFKARLAGELVQPVLTTAQIDGLLQRRTGLLEWVAEMERIHGAAIWAWE
jgi:hypothetical protein